MKKLGDKKIGLIGVGNMGTAVLDGALHKNIATPSQIWVYDKISRKAENYSKHTGVHKAASQQELVEKADVIFLAIKPQDFESFALENKHHTRAGQCLISILAGVTTSRIQKALGSRLAIVRAMPNLAAKIGESMTVVCGNKKPWLTVAETLFRGSGAVVLLPEKQLDLVTALSGSGPAYFFYLMELMTDFGIRNGLSQKVASTLAVQTGVGAALLAKESEASCAELRRRVTSKKGTTEAALLHLKKRKFAKIFHQALQAAINRSRALRKA